MDVKELLDEDALDPKKYFDKEKYNTLTIAINEDGDTKFSDSDIDVLIDLLDENISREEKEERLAHLKKNELQALLIKAIKEAENNEDRAKLICACWESGLDFKNDFLFFVELTCHNDFSVAMEAFTVAENIENINEEGILTKAIIIIDSAKNGNPQLIEDLKSNILSRKI